MSENKGKSNHEFTVNLEGLNLSDQQLQSINKAIQATVMGQLAGFDNVKTGGLLSLWGPQTRGIWYREKFENFM